MAGATFGNNLDGHQNPDYSKADNIREYNCGHAPFIDEIRIVNGHDVATDRGKNNITLHGYPWMVRISKTKNGRHFCGGVLISRKHVITAAHCMVSCGNRRNIRCKIFRACIRKELRCVKKGIRWAILGDYDRRTNNDGEVYMEIKKSTTHPDMNRPNPPHGGYVYDFSIATLKDCVQLTLNVQVVCLPKNDKETFEGEKADVIGWGHLSWHNNNDPLAGVTSNTLQVTTITVLSNADCKKQNNLIENIYNSSYMMCAGDKDEWKKDACTMDSGGNYILNINARIC